MTPSMVLYLLFFATVAGVVIIAVDPGDPDVMHRPPRDPKVPITNRTAVMFWLLYAVVLFLAALDPARRRARRAQPGPAERVDDDDVRRSWVSAPSSTRWSTGATPPAGSPPPVLKALAISLVPVALIVFLATELPASCSGAC